MRLPHSAQNVQPGFYFYPSQDSQSFDLLSVESKNVILCRVNGNWKPYGFIKQFWENPSDNEIPLHDVKKAVALVDEHQAAGRALTEKEISIFDVMY
jgi:hypothetical protein